MVVTITITKTTPPIQNTITTTAPRIYCAKSKKSKNQKRDLKPKQTQQYFKLQNPSNPYPKSLPTPILTTQKPRPRTKLEALDAVVNDLEDSLDKGIGIEIELLASLLESCYQLGSIHHGARIHRLIPPSLLRRNVGLSSKLLRLYASLGQVQTAHEVFDQMPERNKFAFSWNSLISGYAEERQYEEALAIYFQMEEEGVEPDRFTFPRVLKACGGIGSVELGEAVHRHIVRSGFWGDVFVLNSLVDMYAKCGDIVKAMKVFNKIGTKDLITWNSMLTGFVHHGLLAEALGIFRGMIRDGYEPDSVAVSSIIGKVAGLIAGAEIHGWVVRRGMERNLSVANSLIGFYSNNREWELARRMFDQMPERDVVSWNSIIAAHSKDPRAFIYFERMERSENVFPDNVTFVSLLSTCARLGMVDQGEELFSIMREKYGIRPIMEHYGCLVNLYGRAGLVKKAYRVITKVMEFKAGPTLWGALLYACCIHGDVEIGELAAKRLFELEPDNEHNFELLMRIYRDSERTEDVERVRMMMVKRGLDS